MYGGTVEGEGDIDWFVALEGEYETTGVGYQLISGYAEWNYPNLNTSDICATSELGKLLGSRRAMFAFPALQK